MFEIVFDFKLSLWVFSSMSFLRSTLCRPINKFKKLCYLMINTESTNFNDRIPQKMYPQLNSFFKQCLYFSPHFSIYLSQVLLNCLFKGKDSFQFHDQALGRVDHGINQRSIIQYYYPCCSRSRRRAAKADKCMVLVHTHGLFIT